MIIMTTDLDNYINCLNKTNNTLMKSSNKRNRDELSRESIYNDFEELAIIRLENLGYDTLKLSGRKLTKYLDYLNDNFKQINVCLKNDAQIGKDIPDLIRLALIAEVSIAISIVNTISKNALENRNMTLKECIQTFKNKSMNKDTASTNKPTSKKLKKDSESEKAPANKKADYEDESDYESSVEGDDADDEDGDCDCEEEEEDDDWENCKYIYGDGGDDDNDDKLNHSLTFNGNLDKDFVSQIFKTVTNKKPLEIIIVTVINNAVY